METILIDEFIVPEESKAEFLERARKIQGFLRTLPVSSRAFFMKKRMERAGTIS